MDWKSWKSRGFFPKQTHLRYFPEDGDAALKEYGHGDSIKHKVGHDLTNLIIGRQQKEEDWRRLNNIRRYDYFQFDLEYAK